MILELLVNRIQDPFDRDYWRRCLASASVRFGESSSVLQYVSARSSLTPWSFHHFSPPTPPRRRIEARALEIGLGADTWVVAVTRWCILFRSLVSPCFLIISFWRCVEVTGCLADLTLRSVPSRCGCRGVCDQGRVSNPPGSCILLERAEAEWQIFSYLAGGINYPCVLPLRSPASSSVTHAARF